MKKNKIILPLVALSLTLQMVPVNALTKDETVYSNLNKDGSNFKTVVVNHLYNGEDEEIQDVTKLKDILNINGKEKFTLNNENLSWQNKGNEIFYQGTIEKDLPITTEITYYLNGEKIEESKLKNKKGNIKIEIKFTNTDSHNVYVNGKSQTLYTPFVVTLGTVMQNKNISNLEISNGKILNTGSKNFVVGLSSPGLYESLDLEELKDLDKITISYDTKSYKSNTFYIVATPKLMDTTDLDVFNKLDEVYSKVDSLQSNMNQIEDGSNKILDELTKKIETMSSSSYTAIDEDTMNKIKTLAVSGAKAKVQEQESILKETVINTLDNSESLNPSNVAYLTLQTAAGSSDVANAILKYTNTCDSNGLEKYRNEIITKTASSDQVLLGLASSLGLINENTPQDYYESITETVALKLIEGCDAYNTSYTVANMELSGLKQTIPEVVYQAILSASSQTAESVSSSVATTVADTFTKETISSLNTLSDALTTLNTGISTYNNEGIKTLSSYKNRAMEYTNLLEKLSDLTNSYKGFGSDNTTTTTFVSVVK